MSSSGVIINEFYKKNFKDCVYDFLFLLPKNSFYAM